MYLTPRLAPRSLGVGSSKMIEATASNFSVLPDLMARADDVTLLTAICVICGETATRTQRLVNGRPAAIDDPLVVIGGMDAHALETYEARCNRHHEVSPPRSGPGAEPSAVRAEPPTIAMEL